MRRFLPCAPLLAQSTIPNNDNNKINACNFDSYRRFTKMYAWYFCGKIGIRTLGTRKGTTVFETAPFDHSGIFPFWSVPFGIAMQSYNFFSFRATLATFFCMKFSKNTNLSPK